MKYKIGSKVIIKKLRRQGVIESHAREYGDWYVKRLDSVGRDYFEDELKPLPEKKEKYCYCVCHCDHEGGCIRGQKECYHCKKVEKPKEECICDLGSPNQEVCPKHSKSKECKHYFKVFEGTCSKCGINRSMKDNPTLSPVKSSEERIDKLKYSREFPNNYLWDKEFGASYVPENKEGIIVEKLNQIIDRLNKL